MNFISEILQAAKELESEEVLVLEIIEENNSDAGRRVEELIENYRTN